MGAGAADQRSERLISLLHAVAAANPFYISKWREAGVDPASVTKGSNVPIESWDDIPAASENYAASRDALRAALRGAPSPTPPPDLADTAIAHGQRIRQRRRLAAVCAACALIIAGIVAALSLNRGMSAVPVQPPSQNPVLAPTARSSPSILRDILPLTRPQISKHPVRLAQRPMNTKSRCA